ncbi:hypothetical protein Salat_2859000 [Sesamum alatum]|uniref:Late embryogenesis abundant protein LEA-2 subgroup domain-containing protein n=1 Tax=Sesamum alatum TaxID=300844 RepID=A0AAE1XM22_9LAMI|nr:hypothetical protein Salat_2859000 [Sesamum alatum]
MANYRTENSEEEALFRSYPYALYFVQSPSTASHANSNTNNYDHSPPRSADQEAARLALSRYSSSRGSNNSFPQDQSKKKLHDSAGDDQVPDNAGKGGGVVKSTGVVFAAAAAEEDEYDYDYGDERKRGWIEYLSFRYSDSGWWVLVQLSWRFLLSLVIALVVFYVAAKPPPPTLSVQIAGIRQFRLGEGVDGSGVATKILSCNCSIHVMIDNNSKLFGLHIHPPIMEMLFGHLPLAISQGREVYGGSEDLTLLRLSVGTRNKAMYGAGRNMEDMLESGQGLPLTIRVRLRLAWMPRLTGITPLKTHKDEGLLQRAKAISVLVRSNIVLVIWRRA